jgi:hypothetical protein
MIESNSPFEMSVCGASGSTANARDDPIVTKHSNENTQTSL